MGTKPEGKSPITEPLGDWGGAVMGRRVTISALMTMLAWLPCSCERAIDQADVKAKVVCKSNLERLQAVLVKLEAEGRLKQVSYEILAREIGQPDQGQRDPFVCPGSPHLDRFHFASFDEWVQDLDSGKNRSYDIVYDGIITRPDSVILRERQGNHLDGYHELHQDGNVRFVPTR